MTTVGMYEARTHFSELLKKVEEGETVVVTRYGVPIAHIVPVNRNLADAASAIEEWRKYRRENNITLGDGITIKELIEEGRR